MAVMTFGTSGSPSIAQYITNRNMKLFDEQLPRAVKAIVEFHYVDDYIESFNTSEKCLRVTREVSMVHADGVF